MKGRNIILALGLILAGSMFSPAYSQSRSDGALWTSVTVGTRPAPQWAVDYMFEYRLKNNWSTTDLYCGTVIADYLISDRLKVGFGAELIRVNNDGKFSWEYRYYPELIYSFPMGGFKAAFRTRILNTFSKWEDRLYEHRNRLKVSYPIKKVPLAPFAFVEPYNQLNNGDFYKLRKIRLAAGCAYAFDNYKIDLYYMLERYPYKPFSRNTLVMDFTLKI